MSGFTRLGAPWSQQTSNALQRFPLPEPWGLATLGICRNYTRNKDEEASNKKDNTSGKETIRWLGVTVGKKKSLTRMHHHPGLYAKRKKPKRKIIAKNPRQHDTSAIELRQTPFLCLRFGDWSSSAKSWFLCVRAPGLLERSIFSANRSTRRQFDDLCWNVPLEAGTLALQSLLLHHLHPWQHLATTHFDHSSCLMQLHRSAVAFTFLSLYLCFAFPSHFLRKLTCFIAVSLCPWWFVTNINRQTSSVYTLNTVELLPKESSRSPLWRGGESVVALLIHGMIYFLHKQNPGVNMCHRRSGSCFFPKLTNSEWSL